MAKKWWEDAWKDVEHVHVFYEIEHEKRTITPGTVIRFKNVRGTFQFRCMAHNVVKDVTWIDALAPNGQMHAFSVDSLKGPVKTKRSLKKK